MHRRRINLLYALINLFLWGAYGVLVAYASRYFVQLGLTNSQSGILLGAGTAASFLLQPLLTGVIERLHVSVQRVVCLLTAAILLCALPLFPLIARRWPAVILFSIACVCVQALPSFVNALGMSAIHDGLPLNYGLCRGLGSVSFALCVQAVNLLLLRFGMRTLAVCSAALTLGLLIAVWRFPRLEQPQQERRRASGFRQFFQENPRFAPLLFGCILLLVSTSALTNFMYQIALFKGNGDAQGTAVMIAAMVELIPMLFFTRMLRRARCDFWLKLSGIFCTLRLALTLLLPGVGGLYAAQLSQMLGYALYTVSSVYYVGLVIPKKDEVKGQTYLGAASTVGGLLASILSGLLIDALGVRKMLLVYTAVSAAGALVLFLSAQRTSVPEKSS